jgi:hypothetical protein
VGPCSLLKFQMAPRLNILCPLGPRKRHPDTHFLFLSKVEVNEPPTGSYGESCPLTRLFFYISLKFLMKIPLNKEMYPFSQKPKERSVPPCSPEAGPLWKQTPISRTVLSISFGVTSKEAHPPPSASPNRVPSERDDQFLEPPSSISQSPW